ncbi:hypothetical protein COV06_02120 [Candidatus Uhrbacteria bacterium CG10_big_fil_rev_8_21_14_0_10_50_16]|uniref:Uncharacterized protein n=1 Tax=Candidatus Uhrbacteria bacterium CG10_big_fil_rev_8_21_14_0_10_50_16 TaxID=1975039 RepID=A0A2H0RMN9_9BACT|nr:MAG: hypothetical protein COV06_02120 [Candidatus Uhrbacteria bacterium CG10_big_fil_rev_8_21_14_0_10_50_16]
MPTTNKKLHALRNRLLSWTEGARASSWTLITLLVLMPVTVMPIFADLFGPIKLVLLYVLTSFAAFAWMAHVYRTRAWFHRAGWMLWLPGFMFFGVVISAIASSAGFASWIGATGQGFTSVASVLCLLFVYSLALAEGEGSTYIRRYSLAAMVGILLAWVVSFLAIAGVPVIGMQTFSGFSTTGTFESLTLLGVALSLLAVGIWVSQDTNTRDTWLPTRGWRMAFGIVGGGLLICTAIGMILTDTLPTQVALLVGSGVFVALGLFDPKSFARPARVLAPMLLFAFSLILLIVPVPWTSSIPVEAMPNYVTTAAIAIETLTVDGPFGSGPGTFGNDFSRFKPGFVNQSPFWNIAFDHGGSHLLTLLATWGLIPFCLLVLFLGWVLSKTLVALIWKHNKEDWQTIAVLASVWIALTTGQVLYASDLPIQLVFWLVTGLLLAHLMKKTTVIQVQAHSRRALLVAFGFIGLGVLFIFALFSSLQWMTSEVLIARAIQVQRSGGSAEELVSLVGSAAGTSRWNAGYTRALAIAHVRNLNTLAGGDVTENAEAMTHAAQSAIAMAQQAIALDPADVRNVRVAADIYTALIPIIANSDVKAVNAHRYARNLDPANPLQHLALARALLTVVDRAIDSLPAGEEKNQLLTDLLVEAEHAVNESLTLRPTSAGLYTQALVYDRQGRLPEAIKQIEVLILQTPNDAVLRFELGVVQLRAGNKVKAIQAFEGALKYAPTYANAKWYLAGLYEEEGRVDEAITQLQDLLVMNPEDRTVKDKLSLLERGLAEAMVVEDLEPLVVE